MAMGKKTSDFFLRDKFEEYLSNQTKSKDPEQKKLQRPGQKARYLGSILDNVLKPLECGLLITAIEMAISCKSSKAKVFEGLDVIYNFLKKLVWIKNNVQTDRIKNFLEEHKLNSDSVNDWPSVIPEYKVFLEEEINKGNIVPKTSPKYRYSVTDWNKAIKKLEEIEIEILTMKGTDSLLSHFDDPENFLSIVLNDSYFFSKKLAKKRFNDIVNTIKKGYSLFARRSKKKEIQSNGEFHYNSEVNKQSKSLPIEEDKDGNTAVRELIENNTGYTVSAGYDSIFLFYIISHIWGDAFDPRNFTNFWNIVLVPGWANFLLDKQAAEDEFAKKMINTFKAICIKHYGMESMSWNRIDKSFDNLKPVEEFIVHGKYTINVIHNKRKGQDHGKIEKINIEI